MLGFLLLYPAADSICYYQAEPLMWSSIRQIDDCLGGISGSPNVQNELTHYELLKV